MKGYGIMEFSLIGIPMDGIKPEDIDASKHLFGAFGHSETEVSAGWIVRYCQERGKGWDDFSYEDIEAYYRQKGLHDGFTFNRLVRMGYIHHSCLEKGRYRPDTLFQIDFRFVAKCYVAGKGQRFGDRDD